MSILTTRTKGIIVFASTVLCMANISVCAADTSTTTTTTAATTGSTSAAGGSGTTGTGTSSSDSSGSGSGSGSAGGDATLYLQEIAQYTNGILTAVNNLPSYLIDISQLAISWLSPDTSDTTATLQGTFATYATQMATSATAQNALSIKMASDFFGTAAPPSFINDMDFNTVLGSPFVTPDPRAQSGSPAIDSAYNYIENAAAVNFSHAQPGASWAGTKGDQQRYANFYRSVSAVQTYDAYILGQIYTDTNAAIPASQAALLTQASTSNWFAQVASEQIGIVLRQILMYNSQSYLLLSQLLQTEKQLLATQAMTNTLLIINGSTNENYMLQKAVQHIGS